MIPQQVSALLDAQTIERLECALKGKGKEGRDYQLVCGNDGSFVPAEKYESEKKRAGAAENALKALAQTLKTLGGTGEVGSLQQDAMQLCERVQGMEQAYTLQLQGVQKICALRAALQGVVHDPQDVLPLLEQAQIEVDERGRVGDELTQELEKIRRKKPYLFLAEEKTLTGACPAPVSDEQGMRHFTLDELGQLSMQEYAAYRKGQNGFPNN